MKKILLSLFAILLIASAAQAQFYQQYFDGYDTNPSTSIIIVKDTAAGNIWQVGKPQKTIFHQAATTPNVLVTDTINNYPTNNISRFTFTGKVQYSYFGPVALHWMQMIDMDKHKDGGIIEYSMDSGATWKNVFHDPNVVNFYGFQATNADTLASTGEYSLSGTDTVWRNVWICFNYGIMSANTRMDFRFTLKTDSINNPRNGWMIDNMMLQMTFVHPVNEMASTDMMKVFPTVTTDFVHIEAKSKNIEKIKSADFMDDRGRLLERFTDVPATYNFSVAKYTPGTYYLRLNLGERIETHEVMLFRN